MKKVLEAMVHLINMGNPVHIVWAAVIFLSTIILIVLHRILKNDKDMLDKYLKFLTLGNTMYPVDELKTIGIDMEDKKTLVEKSIPLFKKIKNHFYEKYKKTNKYRRNYRYGP